MCVCRDSQRKLMSGKEGNVSGNKVETATEELMTQLVKEIKVKRG